LILGVNDFLAQAQSATQWFGGLFNWIRPAAFREWRFDFRQYRTKNGCVEQLNRDSAEARRVDARCAKASQIADGMQTFGRRASGTGVGL
jgi:hypothetical protein